MENQNDPAHQESVSLFIQQKVRRDCLARYEKWLPVMMARAAEHEGHQGVHVIRPGEGGTEYSIIIRYSSLKNAEKWLNSEARKTLINEISDAFEIPDRAKVHPGIDFWFTPPASPTRRPRGWKQWLVTTSVIWPLSFLIPRFYNPLFHAAPVLGTPGIREGIVSASIVALVVFLIMPRYVRAVSGWLHR